MLVLSKAVEKLKVGTVNVISSISELPELPLALDGRLYLVDTDSELYINVDSEWKIFPIILENITYAWGYNAYGQLGTNNLTHTSSPVTAVGGILNWSQLVAGNNHSLGITITGVAYAWGNNANGRLGDGTTTNRSSPVTVIGGITNWSQVSASRTDGNSLGVTSDGIAYGWGRNIVGAAGDGTTTQRTSPVSVVGGLTWSQLSAGGQHSLGITTTGVAYAWGDGGSGRLGDGTTVNKSSPVSVVGGLTWSQLSAGGQHSLGITTTGIAYGWGNNYGSFGSASGVLGDGTTTSRTSPVTVVGGITNWSQVSAGNGHSLGLTSAGIAYGWGANEFGESGDGTRTSRLSPVTVVGGITNWSLLSAGNIASLGITTTGQAYGWGYGEYFNGGGRLGNGTTSNFSSPVAVLGPSNWTDIVIGNHHGLGIITQAKTL
jgi:alpha-tubulin suppressor-like RCC1 family protein